MERYKADLSPLLLPLHRDTSFVSSLWSRPGVDLGIASSRIIFTSGCMELAITLLRTGLVVAVMFVAVTAVAQNQSGLEETGRRLLLVPSKR